jgi:hypothetical protein
MRAFAMCALTLGCALAWSPNAKAGLIGSELSLFEYRDPDLNSGDNTLGPMTIAANTEIDDTTEDGLKVTFNDDQIIMTNTFPGTRAIDPFNGPEFLFSGVTLSTVTIDPASSQDFLGVLTVNGNEILVNFAGLKSAVGSEFILDVNEPATTPVPEPASVLILTGGLVGLVPFSRQARAKRWSNLCARTG